MQARQTARLARLAKSGLPYKNLENGFARVTLPKNYKNHLFYNPIGEALECPGGSVWRGRKAISPTEVIEEQMQVGVQPRGNGFSTEQHLHDSDTRGSSTSKFQGVAKSFAKGTIVGGVLTQGSLPEVFVDIPGYLAKHPIYCTPPTEDDGHISALHREHEILAIDGISPDRIHSMRACYGVNFLPGLFYTDNDFYVNIGPLKRWGIQIVSISDLEKEHIEKTFKEVRSMPQDSKYLDYETAMRMAEELREFDGYELPEDIIFGGIVPESLHPNDAIQMAKDSVFELLVSVGDISPNVSFATSPDDPVIAELAAIACEDLAEQVAAQEDSQQDISFAYLAECFPSREEEIRYELDSRSRRFMRERGVGIFYSVVDEQDQAQSSPEPSAALPENELQVSDSRSLQV